MNAAEWEHIKSLFDAALKQPMEGRAAWLAEICADQPGQAETVVQLLRHYEEGSVHDARELESRPVFEAGQLVAARFQILHLIARGGMGEVYEARDLQLNGIRVALKTMRLGLSTERQAYDRFKREVWVAREIAHEGICRMYDLVEHKETSASGAETITPCLTMKLLEGESLAEFLAKHRPLSASDALPLIRQIAAALQAMHDKQLVHRDLKPSNVMLVPAEGEAETRVVLIDFGLAKPLQGREEVWETKTDVMQPGALYFMAPELLKGQKAGPAADVYALGLLIDEMVTGQPAFPKFEGELLWRKLHETPEPPIARSRGLPLHWQRTILACLNREPAKRPASPSAVIDALENRRQNISLGGAAVSRRKWIGVAAGAATVSTLYGLRRKFATDRNISIAIFPFENKTNQPKYNYLCSGATEELTRQFVSVPGMSVFAVSGQVTPAELAKAAKFSLHGNLEETAGSVELSVRLVENATGELVSEDRFPHLFDNPLAVQVQIAEKTLRAVHARWDTKPKQLTDSNAALTEYLHGRDLWQKRTLDSALEAIACFHRAIGYDPKFALAYAALADTQQVLLIYNHAPTPQLLSDALTYAKNAVALDDSLPECHVSLAAAHQDLWNWDESGRSYQAAIAKQPKFARAHHWYAGFLMQFGRFDAEALERARKGMALDPFDLPSRSNYGLYLWYAGKLAEAADVLQTLEAKTRFSYSQIVLGQVYAALAAASPKNAMDYYWKSIDQAEEVRQRDLEVAHADPGYLKWSDLVYVQANAAVGNKQQAEHYAARLERGLAAGKISASAVAWAYAAMHQPGRTLELLRLGLENREREMLYVKVNPLFRNLHGDPKFQAILQQMKLA